MARDRGEFSIGEAMAYIKDIALEPIRFSKALKDRLTDKRHFTDYDSLSRKDKAVIQFRGYLWGSMPILAPIAMGAGLVAQGAVVEGILVGTGTWTAEGAALKHSKLREQS